MDRKTIYLEQAEILVSRLERLSADSIWAHRVSGYRGALLRTLERIKDSTWAEDQEEFDEPEDLRYLTELVEQGYDLLEKAAREIIA